MRARRLSRARQSPVQSVLIVEPDWHGHRLAYVKYIASYALAQGMDVSIAMGDGATDSPEFAVHPEGFRNRVTLPHATRASMLCRFGVWPAVPDSVSIAPGADAYAGKFRRRLLETAQLGLPHPGHPQPGDADRHALRGPDQPASPIHGEEPALASVARQGGGRAYEPLILTT